MIYPFDCDSVYMRVQHFLNDPHGENNARNFLVLVSFNTVVCGVIIV